MSVPLVTKEIEEAKDQTSVFTTSVSPSGCCLLLEETLIKWQSVRLSCPLHKGALPMRGKAFRLWRNGMARIKDSRRATSGRWPLKEVGRVAFVRIGIHNAFDFMAVHLQGRVHTGQHIRRS